MCRFYNFFLKRNFLLLTEFYCEISMQLQIFSNLLKLKLEIEKTYKLFAS